MKNALVHLFAVSSMLVGASMLSACNTIEGAGKDVETAGEKIQNANCTGEDAKTDSRCQK